MTDFLSVVLFWLLLMALIGAAVLVVPKFAAYIEKKQNKEDTQDIADE